MKKLYLLFFLISTGIPVQIFAQVNLQFGLVAHYTFDNTLLDSSSNHLDLTGFGSPTVSPDRFGNIAGAYALHSASFDYFTAALNPLLAPSQVSLAAWVNLTNPLADQKIAGRATVNGGGYLMGVDSNKVDVEIWDLNNVHFRIKSGNIPANTWKHIAMTYMANDYLKIYVDGIIVDSIPSGTVGVGISSTWTFTIGGAPWQPIALNADGSVDDIYVYQRAINADEVFALSTIVTRTTEILSTENSSSVYPIPVVNNEIIVNFSKSIKVSADVVITDVFGRLIFERKYLNPQTETIPIESMKSGIYNLSIYNEKGKEDFKLVKE